jgi:hypothetical protein
MIGFMLYCAGIVCCVVAASWIVDMVENLKNDSWRHRVTADDLKGLGEALRK